MADQSLYAVDKMGISLAQGSTGDHIPRSESNADPDDMDMAAFGKGPQLKVVDPTRRATGLTL